MHCTIPLFFVFSFQICTKHGTLSCLRHPGTKCTGYQTRLSNPVLNLSPPFHLWLNFQAAKDFLPSIWAHPYNHDESGTPLPLDTDTRHNVMNIDAVDYLRANKSQERCVDVGAKAAAQALCIACPHLAS